MSAVEHRDDQGMVGLRTSLRPWWTALFEPTSVVTERQRHDLEDEQTHAWEQDAACASADPEAWFPALGVPARPQVFAICDACPVRRSCLASSLLRREEGIWAGTTARDRKKLHGLLKAGARVRQVLDVALASQSLFADLLEDVA